MKIQAHYKQFKWLLSQTPLEKERFTLEGSLGHDFNNNVALLESESNQELGRFKVNFTLEYGGGEERVITSQFRTKLGSLIGFLEGEYSLDTPSDVRPAGLQVSVINQNTIAVTLNQTFEQIIENSSTKEEKEKLEELRVEISKPKKDWIKIKPILSWILNFSEKLFFEVLPILLKNYGINNPAAEPTGYGEQA